LTLINHIVSIECSFDTWIGVSVLIMIDLDCLSHPGQICFKGIQLGIIAGDPDLRYNDRGQNPNEDNHNKDFY